MIRSLKQKFISVFMVMTSGVLIVALYFNYASTMSKLRADSEMLLQQVLENEKKPPSRPWDPKMELDHGAPFFTIKSFDDGTYTAVDKYYDLSLDELHSVAQTVLEQENDSGVLHELGLRYLRRETPYGWHIACVEITSEQNVQKNLLRNNILAGAGALVVLFFFSLALAKWIVRPVEKAWQQQKQFVADASHELKTPLTVILSSVDMLQTAPDDQDGHVRWLENIRAEGTRMRRLIEDMLLLARMEGERPQELLQQLDLSDLSESVLLTMESAAFERGLYLESEIEQGCFVWGNRDRMNQLIMILLDNAIKYCTEGGTVKLAIGRESAKTILIKMTNAGGNLLQDETERIFDRFYRTDASRSGTNGYGLGLSIAKHIVTNLGGKIWVTSTDGQVVFWVRLPEIR